MILTSGLYKVGSVSTTDNEMPSVFRLETNHGMVTEGRMRKTDL